MFTNDKRKSCIVGLRARLVKFEASQVEEKLTSLYVCRENKQVRLGSRKDYFGTQ